MESLGSCCNHYSGFPDREKLDAPCAMLGIFAGAMTAAVMKTIPTGLCGSMAVGVVAGFALGEAGQLARATYLACCKNGTGDNNHHHEPSIHSRAVTDQPGRTTHLIPCLPQTESPDGDHVFAANYSSGSHGGRYDSGHNGGGGD